MLPIGAVCPGAGGVTASGSGVETAPPMAKVRASVHYIANEEALKYVCLGNEA
jgi:hypothetical protein